MWWNNVFTKKLSKTLSVFLTIVLTILFSVSTMATYASSNQGVDKVGNQHYQDIEGHWAEKQIKELIEEEIVSGKSKNGKLFIEPNENITRAEFVTLVIKSMFNEEQIAEELKQISGQRFKDVKGHWAKEFIEIARKNNIVGGYEDNTFKPNRNISRAEIVTIAVKAGELKEKDIQINFNDLSEKHWAYKIIKIAFAYNLISGYTDNTFRPNKFATRAEAMVIIKKMFRCRNFFIRRVNHARR